MQELAVFSLIERVYEAARDPKSWPDVVAAFEEASGDSVALFLQYPKPDDPGEVIAPSLDPAFLRAYREGLFVRDPVRAFFHSVPEGVVTPIGNDGLDDAPGSSAVQPAAVPTGSEGQPALFVILDRPHKGMALIRSFAYHSSYASADRRWEIWAALAPHLEHAVQIGRRFQSLERERHILQSAIDRFQIGVLLVRPPAEVVTNSRAAERILAKQDGLSLGPHGLQGAWPAVTQQLRDALSRACEPEGGCPALSVLSLPRPSGRRPLQVLVAVCRIGCLDCTPAPSQERIAALYVTDPDEVHAPSADLLRRFFGLTPSEAALARELATGHSLGSAAAHLGVSAETARTRLKHVLQRTRTHRQAELVQLLLSSLILLDSD